VDTRSLATRTERVADEARPESARLGRSPALRGFDAPPSPTFSESTACPTPSGSANSPVSDHCLSGAIPTRPLAVGSQAVSGAARPATHACCAATCDDQPSTRGTRIWSTRTGNHRRSAMFAVVSLPGPFSATRIVRDRRVVTRQPARLGGVVELPSLARDFDGQTP
jgi:hypothetical protein